MIKNITLGLVVLTCLTIVGCTEKPQQVKAHQESLHVADEPYHKTLFINDLNFLKHEFPQEYEWAQNERQGQLIELERDTCGNDFLEYTYSLNPFPGLGEFYAVNLIGDEQPEYISFLYFSPLLSWTNFAIVYNDQVEPIDTLEVHSKEGLCSISFKKLQSADKYNIVAEWEQSISVYADAGINVYELTKTGLDEIFLTNTYFQSLEKHPDYNKYDQWMDINTITQKIDYIDDDQNGVLEMMIRSTETYVKEDISGLPKTRLPGVVDTISDQIFVHKWNEELKAFEKTQVIGLASSVLDSTSAL